MGFFDKLLGKDTAANDGIEARAAALKALGEKE